MQLRERISAGGARRLRRLNTLIAAGGIFAESDERGRSHLLTGRMSLPHGPLPAKAQQ